MRETMRATINSFDLATVYARACTVQGGWWDNHPCKTLSKFTLIRARSQGDRKIGANRLVRNGISQRAVLFNQLGRINFSGHSTGGNMFFEISLYKGCAIWARWEWDLILLYEFLEAYETLLSFVLCNVLYSLAVTARPRVKWIFVKKKKKRVFIWRKSGYNSQRYLFPTSITKKSKFTGNSLLINNQYN